jgi:hypothetical protein
VTPTYKRFCDFFSNTLQQQCNSNTPRNSSQHLRRNNSNNINNINNNPFLLALL